MEHASVSGGRSAWRRRAAAVLVGCLVLVGCGVRGVQVQQSPLLRFFERASGLLAYVGQDGNVRLVDQKAGHAVKLTEDAGQNQDSLVAYGLPTWAPDGRNDETVCRSLRFPEHGCACPVGRHDDPGPRGVRRRGRLAPRF